MSRSVKVGDVVEYKARDFIYMVKVLENNSDAEWLRVRVEVVETIKESKIFIPLEVGDVFAISNKWTKRVK